MLVREKNKVFNGKKLNFYILKGEITMENNEIMVNEEVMEATEIATSGAGKGFKIAAGIGLAALGSVIAYKYVVKPIVAKIKDKKAQQKIDGESINREK